MRCWHWAWVFVAGATLVGCSDDDGAAACEPVCALDGCMACDTSGDDPACVSLCGVDMTCEAGKCVAPQEATCDPMCGPCQACDLDADPPACVDSCEEGLECNAGRCETPKCDPGCDPCEMCDTSLDTPACVPMCDAGLDCNGSGLCVEPACSPACGICETCDLSGDTPTCAPKCDAGLVCNDTNGICEAPTCDAPCAPCEACSISDGTPTCVSTCTGTQVCEANTCVRDSIHRSFDILNSDFTDDTGAPKGSAVTEACLTCHADVGQDLMQTAHWKWSGETPNLNGHSGGFEVGKTNLINNFCIAVPTNEARCTQCHIGYGWGKDPGFNLDDPKYIDCLSCHADPASGYAKDPLTGGAPVAAADLTEAARSVGEPTRANCGACHFYAGGGNNVKKGDMGKAALENGTRDADVHMGVGMTCADCHRGMDHTMLGQGAHVPVSEGNVACIDCHTAPDPDDGAVGPHAEQMLNNHALDIACQTCHIPAYSRQEPTKMNWDWSTAGNTVRGTETTTLADGTVVTSYDFQKGDFIWQKNVTPEYAWYDYNVDRMTLRDEFANGLGGDANNPVNLGAPTADKSSTDAKIFPFKVMRGQQPGWIDTGSSNNYVVVPKLFGPGGFWAVVKNPSFVYSEAAATTAWTNALTAGATTSQAAYQDGATSFTDDDWGGDPGLHWIYTELYLGLNHEVAPKEMALGQSQNCATECHGNAEFPWKNLGYTKTSAPTEGCDPLSDGSTECPSRH